MKRKIGNWWLAGSKVITGAQKGKWQEYYHLPKKDFDWQSFTRNKHSNFIGGINKYIRENCESKRVLVDVGSSYGFVSIPLSYYFQQVYSFEMNEDNCNVFKLNASDRKNIKLFNNAVSNTINSTIMYEHCQEYGLVSSIEKDPTRKEKFVAKQATTTTIDEACKGKLVDCIKIDVEGHEYHVLNGAMDTIDNCSPLLVIENIDPERKIAKVLEPLGYKIVTILGYNDVCLKRS